MQPSEHFSEETRVDDECASASRTLLAGEMTPRQLMADYFREIEMMLDQSGTCIWMNCAAEELSGYSVETLRALNLEEGISVLVAEEDHEVVRSAVSDALLKRRKSLLDLRFFPSEGGMRHCHVSFIPVLNAAGWVEGVQIRGFDLTAWENASDEVRELVSQQRIVLDSLPHISLMVGLDFRIFYSNQSARTAGVEPGDHVWTALGIDSDSSGTGPGGVSERLLECFHECVKEKSVRKIQNISYRLGLCDLMFAPCGREAFFLYVLDVTAERAAAKALDRVEKHSRLIMEVILQGILQVEPDGRIVFANPAAQQLSGYSDIEIGKVSFQMLFAGGASLIETRYETLSSGEPVVCEDTLICSDHHCVPVLLSLAPVIDNEGRFQGFITSVVDISQRKKNEVERARLSAAVTQTDEAIVIVEESSRMVYVNPAFERLTGYSEEEVLGKTLDILRCEEPGDAGCQQLWAAISEGRAWSGRLPARRKDGRYYTEQCVVSPVYDPNNGPVCFVLFKRDISEQVKKEEQYRHLQKMDALGRLAGGVAHDFNNLLQGIFGLCDVMLMNAVDPQEFEQCVKDIREEARRGSDLTRQLLAFSRKERQTFSLVDLNTIVSEQRKMLKRLIGKHIKLVLDIHEDGARVSAVPAQMEQVLMNLCVNAKDAMPDGGVLKIGTEVVEMDGTAVPDHPELGNGHYVCLSVEDSGVGMDKKVLDRLFEPFFTTKPKDKGTGLGLSLVFSIVDRHGGWISTDSRVGEGTVFRVFFPQADAVEGAADGEPERGKDICSSRGGGAYVLLIDDDPLVRKFSIRALEKSGFRVACAENADQARQFFDRDKDRFDLIFSDIVLPGKNGYDLVREFALEKPDLPIILCSGFHESIVSVDKIREEGLSFLQKPFSVQEMLETLVLALGRTGKERG